MNKMGSDLNEFIEPKSKNDIKMKNQIIINLNKVVKAINRCNRNITQL